MPRKKNNPPAVINGEEPKEIEFDKLPAINEPTFVITEAIIKEGFCNYSYEITMGIGIGRIHKVDGKNAGMLINEDMVTAFEKFNVHLAFIDDIFKHSGIEIDDIDKFHKSELTGLFHVNGFKIKNKKGDDSIILIGYKYVTAGGRIELESPKILLDNLSSYKWYNELKDAAEKAKLEVWLYDQGKYTKAEPDLGFDNEQGNLFEQDLLNYEEIK